MASITKRQNKDGETSYLIRVYLHENLRGKQVTKSMTWKPPVGMKTEAVEKQAHKEAVLFEERVKNGVVTIDGSMKFADYSEKWLENKELKTSTRELCFNQLRIINQAIGHIPLEKLRPEHLQTFYKNLREEGIKSEIKTFVSPDIAATMGKAKLSVNQLAKISGVSEDAINKLRKGKSSKDETINKLCIAFNNIGVDITGLFIEVKKEPKKQSQNTILRYHALIRSILKSAKKSRIISNSVVEFMDTPKTTEPKWRFLDDVQVKEYFIALLNEPDIRIKTALAIFLFAGIRRGELLGLDWDDIDFLDSKIHIRRAVYYTAETGTYADTPKTKSSIRSITVSSELLNMLYQYRDWQNEIADIMGDEWKNEKNRLFTAVDGGQIHPGAIDRWVKKFHANSGLPYINPHGLRHTFITLQLTAGVDIRTIQARSGHSNATTLLNVYSHAIQSAQDKAAQVLNDVIIPDNPPFLLTDDLNKS